ncbi:MAG: two-component system, chemotaxis family, sensor kinase CheA, partial [Actinomycetota bacterium]|nr:two-component system, chemotaxis family, sensor kinase CheA [Actinomycetota bacterium]
MTSPPRGRFLDLFADEAETRLRRLSEQVLMLEAGPSADIVGAILRDAHSLKGAAAVVGLSGVSTVAHQLEDLMEPYRAGTVAPPAAAADRLLMAIDGLQSLLPAIRRQEDTAPATDALLARLGSQTSEAAATAAAAAAPTHTAPAAEGPATAPPPRSTAAFATAPSAPPVPARGTVPSAPSPAAPATLAPPPPAAAPAAPPAPPAPSVDVIELPAERVDEIARAVGESAASSLRLGRVLSERLGTDPERLSEFRDLSRSIRHLHEKAMRARMVPVASITGRLHRAARDVARRGDKQIDWEAHGEETELDRAVLGQLADSLLHIVRNAVDHGVETAAERAAAGKPERATIRFDARQVGADVVIAVTDDGRGIDTDAVRREAARHGVATDALSDGDVNGLIFRGGVSTAATLSQTSGRGVGLDVVRAGVERLRGRVEVTSVPGAGTEFRLVVPVAAAVVPCLLVSAAGRRFALPMSATVSTQAADATSITRAQGAAKVWVADTVVPLLSLSPVLGVGDSDDGPVVVVSSGRRTAAYQVESLIGQRDVMVTGLGPFVPKLPLVTGAAVEADGSILMVLDAVALAEAAFDPSKRTPPSPPPLTAPP